MSSPSPFTLRFIGDIDDNSKDSVLKIQPSTNDTFDWIFRESGDAKAYKTVLMRNSVNARIENLLRLVDYDAEPPTHVQIDAPGYPQIIVTYDDLGRVRELITDAVDFAMGAWPMTSGPCVQSEEFEDMPPLEEDDESTIPETDSMPPLVDTDSTNYMNYGNYNWDVNAPPTNFWINA